MTYDDLEKDWTGRGCPDDWKHKGTFGRGWSGAGSTRHVSYAKRDVLWPDDPTPCRTFVVLLYGTALVYLRRGGIGGYNHPKSNTRLSRNVAESVWLDVVTGTSIKAAVRLVDGHIRLGEYGSRELVGCRGSISSDLRNGTALVVRRDVVELYEDGERYEALCVRDRVLPRVAPLAAALVEATETIEAIADDTYRRVAAHALWVGSCMSAEQRWLTRCAKDPSVPMDEQIRMFRPRVKTELNRDLLASLIAHGVGQRVTDRIWPAWRTPSGELVPANVDPGGQAPGYWRLWINHATG